MGASDDGLCSNRATGHFEWCPPALLGRSHGGAPILTPARPVRGAEETVQRARFRRRRYWTVSKADEVTIHSDAISPSRSPRTRGAAAPEDDLGLIDLGAREPRVEAGPCPHDAGHVNHGAANPADEVVMPGITRLIEGAPGAGIGDEDVPGADQPPSTLYTDPRSSGSPAAARAAVTSSAEWCPGCSRRNPRTRRRGPVARSPAPLSSSASPPTLRRPARAASTPASPDRGPLR